MPSLNQSKCLQMRVRDFLYSLSSSTAIQAPEPVTIHYLSYHFSLFNFLKLAAKSFNIEYVSIFFLFKNERFFEDLF